MRYDSRSLLELTISYCFFLALILILSSCQISPPATEKGIIKETGLSPLPTLPIKGAAHYKINSDQSEIRILVYRGGPLAKFGHNHVMLAKQIMGDVYLAPALSNSGFILTFPVKQIEIDLPKARAEEGEDFATRPSPEAIDGTRKNMLGPDILDAETYPTITIRSVNIKGPEDNSMAKIQITMHGVTKELSTPVSIEHSEDNLMASGALTLRTSDFNIKPFSVLGGGLQVQDEIKIRFHILADKD